MLLYDEDEQHRLKTIVEFSEKDKELLGLVLGVEIVKINSTRNNHINYDAYGVNGTINKIENLDTVGKKCKEWCLLKKYCLMSCIHEKNYCVCEILSPIYSSSSLFSKIHKTEDGKTELESIMKATHWVAEQQ